MSERSALYGSTLYSAAFEEGVTESVYEGLGLINSLLKREKGYVKILNSPEIPLGEKEGLIDEAFGGNVHIYVLNYLKILAKKRIADIFAESFSEYEKLYFEEKKIERAHIVTAFELTDARKDEIVKKIEEASGKKVLAEFEVKADIMGGIVIETESSVVDASIKTKLDNIKRYIGKN